ncbi:hypothetical protein FHU33_2666 [Blastococcus colisei]|uniref:Uncharacterized protein n=1 Tax=Blastococcus colisei TaxID=1564162 RepID=A0A543PGM2_9ACTN|nr:hypothetical protein [Blastococcus colisei]TQN43230.1 hypothetical protein FHU33_2666 [Blastococcus colisei]
MAGGMHPGRSGRSLGERAANSGVQADTPAPRVAAAPPRPPVPPAVQRPGGYGAAGDGGEGRHCWVRDPPDAPGTWPGLLVEWRQRGGTWQGRVAYTVTGLHGPALVEAWLPAARLEPR